MEISEFRLVDPGSEFITLLYETVGADEQVVAINISTTDCLGRNIAQTLAELDELHITLNNILYTFIIRNAEPLITYYHFLVENQVVSNIDSVVEGVCRDVVTVPSYLGSSFEKSEYQAILNNVNTGRTTSLIFDVDRQKMAISASNIDLINTNTATLANYQELNYTSLGLTNSRYAGSKTTRLTYGTVAGISLDTFEGTVYNGNVDNDRICSQSVSSKEEAKVILGLNEEFNIGSSTPNGLPSYTKSTSATTYSGYISGSSGDVATLNNTRSTIEVDWRRSEVSKLQLNGLYHFMTGDTEEFFILKSFSYLSSKVVSSIPLNTYSMVIERGVNGATYSHEGTVETSWKINIKKVEASQIFQFDGNKISTLSNRKVYLPLTDIVLEVGKNGMVYSGSLACT